MTIQLFKDGKQIIASDGIMWVDGRLSEYNVTEEVIKRNLRYEKNFPHLLADAWQRTGQRLQGYGPIVNLPVDLEQQIRILQAEKVKKYGHLTNEDPMSEGEKELNGKIADLYSRINQIIKAKRKARQESASNEN
jgi:hypothetical protein